MNLEAELKSKGWYLSEKGINKCKEGQDKISASSLIQNALDMDLKDIGGRFLSEDGPKGMVDSISGPCVLQIQRVRNASAPKYEYYTGAPPILRLLLTDGNTNLNCLQWGQWNSISMDTPAGTKIFLKPGKIPIQNNFLLLSEHQFSVLGGCVAALVEKWELKRHLASHVRTKEHREGGPPIWVPFGKAIVTGNGKTTGINFRSLDQDGKEEKENAVFKQQRQANIEEVSKAKEGKVKVFGGGKDMSSSKSENSNPHRRGESSHSYNKGENSYPYSKGENSHPYNRSENNYSHNKGENSLPYNRGENSYSYNKGENSLPYNRGENSYSYNKGESNHPYNRSENSYSHNKGENSHPYNRSENSYPHNKGENSYPHKSEDRNSYHKAENNYSYNKSDTSSYKSENSNSYNRNYGNAGNYNDKYKTQDTDAAARSYNKPRGYDDKPKFSRSNTAQKNPSANESYLKNQSNFPDFNSKYSPNQPQSDVSQVSYPQRTAERRDYRSHEDSSRVHGNMNQNQNYNPYNNHYNPRNEDYNDLTSRAAQMRIYEEIQQRVAREKAASVQQSFIKPGAEVKAKYWEDNRFYPAIIHAVGEDGTTCVVCFTEYGNYEEVLVKDVQEISSGWNAGPISFQPTHYSNAENYFGENASGAGEFRKGANKHYRQNFTPEDRHRTPRRDSRPPAKLYQPPRQRQPS